MTVAVVSDDSSVRVSVSPVTEASVIWLSLGYASLPMTFASVSSETWRLASLLDRTDDIKINHNQNPRLI